ncbi:MAG: adenylate/guanylate cyclase domain-containing protein [Dehalococcoidia bacterium]
MAGIQYATTSDGVSIAYLTTGDGKPHVTMPVPCFSHAELTPQMFGPIFGPLSERYRVVTYDSRGSGLSDRSAIDFSMEAMLRDLDAVVERSGFDKFTLAAWITATPIAVTYAATHPERVTHLILNDGWSRFSDFSESPAYKAGEPLLEGDWMVFTETFAQVLWAYANPEYGRLFAEFIRACCDQETMQAAWEAWATYDASELLGQVATPTLVVQNKNSRWFSMDVGRRLAAGIPNARLALIDDITYAPVPDLIREFVGEEDEKEAEPAGGQLTQQGSFRTVLFTDLVGHTEMMSRLGDTKGRDVLREHERISREVLSAHGGTEVKTMGDGFMASFGSVTKAVECAIDLQRAFAGRDGEPLSVRVGINAGEPIEEEGDLFGATVILASRIAAKAEGGEILVSDVVRGLCSGKGFLFADRGEFVAKGFEDPVRLFEVRWREE